MKTAESSDKPGFRANCVRITGNLLLIAISLVLSLLVMELLARIVLDPADYLLPNLVEDDFLFHRIEGYSGGHDAWGFRNTQVPKSADIVCIGDSLTYGMFTKARESWPAVLGQMSGMTVYNMGLGGYGPIQYLYLMRSKAIELHPKIVIVGFYFGNDFMDVYNEVHYNKHWAAYAKLGYSDPNGSESGDVPQLGKFSGQEGPPLAYQPKSEKLLAGPRDWLARHSVFYALLRASVFNYFGDRKHEPGEVITYRDDEHSMIFDLSPLYRYLDMNDSKMKFAMEVTKQVILDMRSLADDNAFRLVVALIPTKERAYAELLDRAGYLDKYPRLAVAVHQEDVARDMITGFLRQSNIETVDLLPELETAVEKEDVYFRIDLHLNKDGHRVIAEAMNHYLGGSH